MNLFILRHAIAVQRGTPGYAKDSERPLTSKGKRQFRKAAKGMKALGLSFDIILSSPYVRARQTAEIVAKVFKARKKLRFSDSLSPAGTSKEVIDCLNSLKPAGDNILLVGHEPNLSRFISLLVAGDARLSLEMKKGGLCKLSAQILAARRCAAFKWLLTPKQMALMA